MKRNLLFAAGVGIAMLFASGCAKKPADQGAVTGPASIKNEATPGDKAQTTCPVMGNKVDKTSPYVDVEGKRIYVCCQDCVQAVKKDPAKYIAKLEAEGVKIEAAPTAGGK